MKTLEEYVVESKMRYILAELWALEEVVTQKNGYHSLKFRATSGTTQGSLKSMTLFNMAVGSAVRHWLYTTVEDDTIIHDGLGHEVGRILGVLYAGDGILG